MPFCVPVFLSKKCLHLIRESKPKFCGCAFPPELETKVEARPRSAAAPVAAGWSSFDGIVIHWYQQKEGKSPERLLFYSGGKPSFESGFQADRYMIETVSSQNRCVFTIKDVIPDDAATYYCAYWDPHCDRNSKIIKVFGSGTKLIVSLFCSFPPISNPDKVTSSPASSEILQKRHGNQIMYVCLIEKFYPEVIRVTWTDEANKEVTDNIVKGDVWKPANGDKYSIGSWLTVPAKNKDKNYYCKYEHESQHIQKFLKTVLPLC
uniref:Ig-like domain-containing protein n=1 Tax=Athene cunicularia TaxID=194338 RepID=A0A663M9G5_ATHCN